MIRLDLGTSHIIVMSVALGSDSRAKFGREGWNDECQYAAPRRDALHVAASRKGDDTKRQHDHNKINAATVSVSSSLQSIPCTIVPALHFVKYICRKIGDDTKRQHEHNENNAATVSVSSSLQPILFTIVPALHFVKYIFRKVMTLRDNTNITRTIRQLFPFPRPYNRSCSPLFLHSTLLNTFSER
ncbi:hypothetical protein J6590_040615 [Homalodisca vitripennis]|nr:hypothetical protein J6590_040615 [Homalodisca vitripennis]